MSNILPLGDESEKALKSFSLPEDMAFGRTMLPLMVQAIYREREWGELKIVPYGKLAIDPAAKVLHYGQEIFEGMKAYCNKDGGPYLFRPEDNFIRFNASAQRMAMPEVPKEYFMKAVFSLAHYGHPFIPREKGDALYLRPFMFASEPHLNITLGNEYQFLAIASPSWGLFKDAQLSVKIENHYNRAVKGGVGHAKTGGNYGRRPSPSGKGQQRGV